MNASSELTFRLGVPFRGYAGGGLFGTAAAAVLPHNIWALT